MKNAYTKEQQDQILLLYNSGMSVKNVAKETGFGRKAIFNLIEKLVPDKRTTANGQAQRARHGTFIKEDVFDTLTPEALYWIGFLYADGGIEAARPIVSLGISEEDKPHLEKYNQFLGGKLHINEVVVSNKHLKGSLKEESLLYRVVYSNKHIHSKLMELGFTNNKSNYILPNPLLITSRDFWRGCIDGDGWVYKTQRKDCLNPTPGIGLSGTELTLIKFVEFINMSGIVTNGTPLKRTNSKVWQIDLHSDIAKKVANLLYKDATVYLDRKYQAYCEITGMRYSVGIWNQIQNGEHKAVYNIKDSVFPLLTGTPGELIQSQALKDLVAK
jgi:hypothetical protein